jgi:hypothetical protein
MTMPIQFDTLEYARRLAEAGIPEAQADAHAQALSDVLANAIVVPGDLLLLKTDLVARMDILRHDVDAKLMAFREEFRLKLEALEARIHARLDKLGWLVAASLIMNAAILVKLFA